MNALDRVIAALEALGCNPRGNDARGYTAELMAKVATTDPGNKYGAIYQWGTIGIGIKMQALVIRSRYDRSCPKRR